METVFDVIGVGLFIVGVWSVLIAVLQGLAVGFGSRELFGSRGSIPAGIIVFVLGGAWGAFLIWAGHALWGVTPS